MGVLFIMFSPHKNIKNAINCDVLVRNVLSTNAGLVGKLDGLSRAAVRIVFFITFRSPCRAGMPPNSSAIWGLFLWAFPTMGMDVSGWVLFICIKASIHFPTS